jgi:malonyl-CoA O-methyltransferase
MVLSHPDHLYYGIDISAEVLKYVNSTKIKTRTGNLLNTGCKNDYFDLVYAAESIEHAIFIDLAVREMYRITKVGGSIVVIDKDVEAFQTMKYREWFLPEELSTKQWLDTNEMINVFRNCGIDNMEIIDIPSDEGQMYKAYIGRKEK